MQEEEQGSREMIRIQMIAVFLFAMMSAAWADGKADLARGVHAEVAQNYVLALQYYDAAIRSAELPQRSKAIAVYNRGNVYFKIEKEEKAIKDYTHAISLRPDFADAYTNRALVYAKRGLHELAIKDLSKAIEINSSDALAYVDRGNEYEALMQNDKALADWRKAYELGHRPPWLVARLKSGKGS